MSLINQVLLDLDRRHAVAAAPGGHATVNAASTTSPARTRWSAMTATAGVVAIAAAALHASPTQLADAAKAVREIVALARMQRGDAPARAATAAAMPKPTATRAPIAAAAAVAPDTLPADGKRPSTAETLATPPAVTAAATSSREAPGARGPIAPTSAADATPSTLDADALPAAAARIATARRADLPAGRTTSRPASANGDAAAILAVKPQDASVETAPLAAMRLDKGTAPSMQSDRADAEYRRGLDLHARGSDSDAAAAFAAALELDGDFAAARRALAVLWIAAGRSADAERLVREGLTRNSHQASLAVVLARLQAERQDIDAALDTLRAARVDRIGADSGEALALLGTLQQAAGRPRAASEAFTAALRLAPQNATWWVGLGVALAADGRSDEAREAFERASGTGTLSAELRQYVEQRLRSGAR